MNIFILLLLSSLSFSSSVSIKELIQKAETYSPQLKGEAFNISASEGRQKQARLLPNPIFTYQGGRLKSGNLTGSVNDFTLSQPLPWPGKRSLRIETQNFLRKLSEISKEEAKLEIVHRVMLKGAELAALQELQSHYDERKRRFALIEKALKSRPQASPRQQVDKDLIESQMNLMEKDMIDLEARKSALVWELKIFTNSTIETVSHNWNRLPTAMPREHYLSLIDTSPQGKRLRVEEQLAGNRIEEAALEARPDILVGVNYRKENVEPVNHFYHGQVAIVIPIVDRGQHSVEAAKAEERRTKAFNQLERDELASHLHQFYSQYESNKKAMEVFELKKVGNLEKKFGDAETSFRKGFIDALTFLQIDSQVHENIDQIYLTRLNYINALSNLNLLVGKAPEI